MLLSLDERILVFSHHNITVFTSVVGTAGRSATQQGRHTAGSNMLEGTRSERNALLESIQGATAALEQQVHQLRADSVEENEKV